MAKKQTCLHKNQTPLLKISDLISACVAADVRVQIYKSQVQMIDGNRQIKMWKSVKAQDANFPLLNCWKKNCVNFSNVFHIVEYDILHRILREPGGYSSRC